MTRSCRRQEAGRGGVPRCQIPDARTRAPKGQPAKANTGWNLGDHATPRPRALKGHTEPGACDSPLRLCARPSSFRSADGTGSSRAEALGRRGRETRHRHRLRGLAAWRLCLSCLSLKGTKGKSREASKPQREERLRANREVRHFKTLSDPDPPFQGFLIIRARVPGVMPQGYRGPPRWGSLVPRRGNR